MSTGAKGRYNLSFGFNGGHLNCIKNCKGQRYIAAGKRQGGEVVGSGMVMARLLITFIMVMGRVVMMMRMGMSVVVIMMGVMAMPMAVGGRNGMGGQPADVVFGSEMDYDFHMVEAKKNRQHHSKPLCPCGADKTMSSLMAMEHKLRCSNR